MSPTASCRTYSWYYMSCMLQTNHGSTGFCPLEIAVGGENGRLWPDLSRKLGNRGGGVRSTPRGGVSSPARTERTGGKGRSETAGPEASGGGDESE